MTSNPWKKGSHLLPFFALWIIFDLSESQTSSASCSCCSCTNNVKCYNSYKLSRIFCFQIWKDGESLYYSILVNKNILMSLFAATFSIVVLAPIFKWTIREVCDVGFRPNLTGTNLDDGKTFAELTVIETIYEDSQSLKHKIGMTTSKAKPCTIVPNWVHQSEIL